MTFFKLMVWACLTCQPQWLMTYSDIGQCQAKAALHQWSACVPWDGKKGEVKL